MNITLKAKLGAIVNEGRLKDLTAGAGLALRKLRLKGFADPDDGMEDLHVYELWKRIVEVYSRTRLTVSRDKLIALSGIARLFHEQHFNKTTKNEYVAGMWSKCLESQLLWQVNEEYREGVFENPARRDATRAPSFSWASIDTPFGITYGDVTDYGEGQLNHGGGGKSVDPTAPLLFKVQRYETEITDPENEFGMVKECLLWLKPRYLRSIKLSRLEPPLRVPYSWRLTESKLGKPIEHSNLYLDAPDSDVDIFSGEADLYCMPAAYGERTVHETQRYLYCLLLKYEKDYEVKVNGEKKTYRQFRRIGITKLSGHADDEVQKDVRAEEANELIRLM
jgi:hypothetical protein